MADFSSIFTAITTGNLGAVIVTIVVLAIVILAMMYAIKRFGLSLSFGKLKLNGIPANQMIADLVKLEVNKFEIDMKKREVDDNARYESRVIIRRGTTYTFDVLKKKIRLYINSRINEDGCPYAEVDEVRDYRLILRAVFPEIMDVMMTSVDNNHYYKYEDEHAWEAFLLDLFRHNDFLIDASLAEDYRSDRIPFDDLVKETTSPQVQEEFFKMFKAYMDTCRDISIRTKKEKDLLELTKAEIDRTIEEKLGIRQPTLIIQK
jgi:hypothetical protein